MVLKSLKNGAPEEIRTPDPQIRSLGASTLKSPVESDPITTSAAARPHSRSRSGPRYPLRFLEIGRVLRWPVACIGLRGRTCRHRVGSLKPASRTRRSRNWPVFQGFDLPPEPQWWQLGPPAGLHRGSPPSESGGSRNARFYWVFRTSRLGGGEGGIRTPISAPAIHHFCGLT
jgi:hypothetical protein